MPEGVKVEMDLDEGFTAPNVDAPRLKRDIGNLIDNAIEAMPDGGTLRVRVYKVKSAITVTVLDTGVGIVESARSLVFKPFTRRSPTGLGSDCSTRRT